MMGVGKTTIGKKLAEKLKIKFVDIDKIIEAREKKTIKEIFELDGESYFREIEKNITLDILRKKKLVIALGGGAFMNSEIRKEVIKTSISVWLDLSPKNLISRLKNTKKRPLLNKNNLNELVNEIYSRRKKNYNESNCRIKCDFLEKNQIVNKIINLYEKSKNKD